MKTKVIIIALGILIVGFLGYKQFFGPTGSSSQLTSTPIINNSPLTESYKLENELVCMVNNTYMGIPQIPVVLGEKTYYGCCEDCKKKLGDSDVYRYAQDPYTGEKVDKAIAFIVRKSNNSPEVYYFKSEENFVSYSGNTSK